MVVPSAAMAHRVARPSPLNISVRFQDNMHPQSLHRQRYYGHTAHYHHIRSLEVQADVAIDSKVLDLEPRCRVARAIFGVQLLITRLEHDGQCHMKI